MRAHKLGVAKLPPSSGERLSSLRSNRMRSTAAQMSTVHRSRWSHVYAPTQKLSYETSDASKCVVNWASVGEPAILPVTTEHLPLEHVGELDLHESNWSCTGPAGASPQQLLALMLELVCQRLLHDFQIVTPRAPGNGQASIESLGSLGGRWVGMGSPTSSRYPGSGVESGGGQAGSPTASEPGGRWANLLIGDGADPGESAAGVGSGASGSARPASPVAPGRGSNRLGSISRAGAGTVGGGGGGPGGGGSGGPTPYAGSVGSQAAPVGAAGGATPGRWGRAAAAAPVTMIVMSKGRQVHELKMVSSQQVKT